MLVDFLVQFLVSHFPGPTNSVAARCVFTLHQNERPYNFYSHMNMILRVSIDRCVNRWALFHGSTYICMSTRWN